MPPTPPSTPEPGEARIRDRGDACPGALRLHPADDGHLARLRLPGGRLTVRQARVLAAAAEALGDGRISITSRGNAELRGLADDCGSRLAALLDDAGLLPSPSHERVRNIVASPAAGLDGLGHGAAQLWTRELDSLLCAQPWTAALSGRFLFVLDDGPGDVAGLGGDVTLIAVEAAGAPGALLHVGGQGFLVAGEDAARAALAGAEAFLAAARAAGNGAWRVRELPPGTALDVAGALARAGIEARPVPDATLPQGEPPVPGVLGANGLYVLAPLGRLTATQLRALADGAEELRLTPWRGVVVVDGAEGGQGGHERAARSAAPRTGGGPDQVAEPPAAPRAGGGPGPDQVAEPRTGHGPDQVAEPRTGHGPDQTAEPSATPRAGGGQDQATEPRTGHGPDRATEPSGGPAPGTYAPQDRLGRLAALGLVASAAAPLAGVSACTGRPGCGKALADVRADAGRAPAGGLPVHYSGCERRCGHPHGAWVDVLAVGDDRYLVDGAPTPRTSLTDAVATARTTR
ncbi:cobalamin biosynthesis protein CobG [Streptomyces roseoviridis]|uniref:Cobalamin biosynthesis protein CobG n=1 Tax=Streptomyces roseoviridis TaxID=67361 RepID=A0ABV5QMW0_9ACTN